MTKLFSILLFITAANAFADMSEVVVVFRAPENAKIISEKAKPNEIIRSLQEQLEQSLANFAFVDSSEIKLTQKLWIAQAASMKVTRRGLRLLKNDPSVLAVVDADLKPNPLRSSSHLSKTLPSAELYNSMLIHYPELMAKYPELRGQNMIIGMIDTGVDGKHPEFKNKIQMFYDAFLERVSTPVDRATHGTHVAGTMVCSKVDEKTIGFAPEAKLLVGGGLSFKGILGSMQFMADPDQNPETNDFPRVVNNSWAFSKTTDIEAFYRALDVWENLGILAVFAAGNIGPNAQTIEKPQNHASVLAVGAIGPDAKVLSISSRGPAYYQGKMQQKPDLVAPGRDIFSTKEGGGYRLMSGTSMASPHVAAIAALMVQANSKLTAAELKKLLIESADSVDANGNPIETRQWNPDYGFGKMNAERAIEAALRYQ